MRTLLLGLISVLSLSAFADQTCYQVSSKANVWSRTPELLCIEKDSGNDYVVVLKTGMGFEEQTVASFNLSLLSRARCMECNMDVFGVSNPSNSSFNALQIQFNGAKDILTHKETGTVSIGKTKFYYRQ